MLSYEITQGIMQEIKENQSVYLNLSAELVDNYFRNISTTGGHHLLMHLRHPLEFWKSNVSME